MRLFHVSEEPNIAVFEPRLPKRKDLDPSVGLVWAINDLCLSHFLTPRDCLRVAYYATENSRAEDLKRFFSDAKAGHVVAIDHRWLDAMLNTTLYIYEFDATHFYLQDDIAGYYVSEVAQRPIAVHVVTHLFEALRARQIEVRLLPNLLDLADEVKTSSLNWSLCRMGNLDMDPNDSLQESRNGSQNGPLTGPLTGPLNGPLTGPVRVDHLGLWSVDIERLKDFYGTYFGARSNLKYVNAKKGFESYFLTFRGGSRLEIMQSMYIRGQVAKENRLGLDHLALSVASREEVLALTDRLRHDGFEVVSEPRTTGDGYFESVVLDCDGNKVEIVSRG